MRALIVLESRYCKIKDWIGNFFIISGTGWEFPVRQINCAEFSVGALWGSIPNDKVVRLIASPDELHHIVIIKEWVKNHPNAILLEALLRE